MGSVSAGEITHHLTILGSCTSVSNDATDSTYYLGRKGRLKVVRQALPDDTDDAFQTASEVMSQDLKSLVAH